MSEIPEDAVESACAAFYNEGQLTDWNRLVEVDPYLAERYRKFMKTALKVAAPLIREDERRRIAEEIRAIDVPEHNLHDQLPSDHWYAGQKVMRDDIAALLEGGAE